MNMKKSFLKSLFLAFPLFITVGCYEREFDPNDAAKSFEIARQPYDDENYEIALNKLGEFKSRFPYSQFSALADLFSANSHFELGQYEEAAVVYEHFIKLHPKHEQVDFAMFRVGECFWATAPESVDRDQANTLKALEYWKRLIDTGKTNSFVEKAKELSEEGARRMAENRLFVVRFYCRQGIDHACAYQGLKVAEEYARFADIRVKALRWAASALDRVALEKEKDPDSDANLYHANLSADEIRAKAAAVREILAK